MIIKQIPRTQSASVKNHDRLQRCIAMINRWTDYCNNREIIVVIIGCLKNITK